MPSCPDHLRLLALLALAGAAGALTRYLLAGAINSLTGASFPWGIFVTNVLGCFLFGLIWELATVRGLFSEAARTILATGFVGAFTTFSTLVFDLYLMERLGQWLALAANLCGQLVLGFAALRLGMLAVRLF